MNEDDEKYGTSFSAYVYYHDYKLGGKVECIHKSVILFQLIWRYIRDKNFELPRVADNNVILENIIAKSNQIIQPKPRKDIYKSIS